MSILTENLKLIKPEFTDPADITAMNQNWDIVDDKLSKTDNHVNNSSNPHNVTAEQIGAATTASYRGTFSTSGWSSSVPYTQSITVSGILASDEPFVDVNLEGVSDGASILEAWMAVGRITASANNTITAYCYEEKPTVNIPIILKVVR